MIRASVYLLVFIRSLLVHHAEKVLLLKHINFWEGGGLPDLLTSMRVGWAAHAVAGPLANL
jgi:hypothetical protein